MRSITSMHRGSWNWPGMPSTWLMSAGPTNKRSTSGIAAIASTSSMPPRVSIWMPTNTLALAVVTYSAVGSRP